MSALWRCRVCEGVNQGGRVCTTCGAVVPRGEPLRAAVRARVPLPRTGTPPEVPAPVPPTPRRRDLRELPTIEDLLAADPAALFMPGTRMSIRPMPGGCVMGPVPAGRRRRRRRWY